MKNILIKILGIFIVLSALYVIAIYLMKPSSLLPNEFGDYIGGVLNPLFPLLSTISIIILTYVIAKADNKKADEAIETQKRITLNQMRHDALNLLDDKLNLFVHEIDNLHFIDSSSSKFVKKVLAHNVKKERKEKGEEKRVSVWLAILFELESFSQREYLFNGLFTEKDFEEKFQSLQAITETLIQEHHSEEIISTDNFGKFIELKNQFTAVIGNYIIREF